LKTLTEGNVEAFTRQLTQYLFTNTSSHDFINESDYHSFVLGLLVSILESHQLYSNQENGLGRPDCLLIPKAKDKPLGILLEFKTLRLRDAEKKSVEVIQSANREIAKKALEQIDLRAYSQGFSEYTHVTEVLKVGIAFSHRFVSTAHQVCEIKNGVETENKQNQAIVYYGFDGFEIITDPNPDTTI